MVSASTGDAPDRHRVLRLKIERVKLEIYYTTLAWFSVNLLLFFLLMFIAVLDTVLPVPKVISINPTIISFTGNGTPITHLVSSFALIEVIRNTVTIYQKDGPSIELQVAQADIDTND